MSVSFLFEIVRPLLGPLFLSRMDAEPVQRLGQLFQVSGFASRVIVAAGSLGPRASHDPCRGPSIRSMRVSKPMVN
jgi:hypothetical protein